MKQLMVDNNSAASHSFLLDDDSSIPFSLDDIQALMDDKARAATLKTIVKAGLWAMRMHELRLGQEGQTSSWSGPASGLHLYPAAPIV